ncbi:hypothetical protein OIB37_14530 [Streptomyces sp. NBC_00820]|uniref:hypothetical protein n=1 Tax=Streptomyces sp. NBC_00820 TaxID=2975842 RepID=UPI002ED152B9|nr:hypothetical protein OIB37_14530 [Streptomyces sp. NBC_00820]
MRRGLVHVLAWLLSTGAAVTLSWWGVHTVMAGTAYDPPRALPITAADATRQAAKAPPPPVTTRPAPSPKRPRTSPSADAPAPAPSTTTAAGSGTSPAPAAPASSAATGQVKAYDTGGGRAVFDLGPADATLVSATPGTGWSMQVWKTSTWIRVEFSRSTDRVTVFCAWNDGPPTVQVINY